jgi:hypothetical protein
MPRSSLGIFLKVPRPGRVKTRLAATLGEPLAASLYRAFLEDTVTLVASCRDREVHLFVDGGTAREALGTEVDRLESAHPGRVFEHRQRGEDLGRRLERAFADAHAERPGPLLVLGSDSPDLPLATLDRALGAADGDRPHAILGATADGGVWCVGLPGPVPGFFDHIPWSHARTGDALRRRAGDLGLDLFEAPAWYDCDEALDLRSLDHRLSGPSAAGSATRTWIADHTPALVAAGILENTRCH